MSPTVRPKPIIHGRDHMPGGADPIPGITGAPGDFETVVRGIPDLYAYWRLGETAGPWKDTSGVAPAADLTEHGTGLAFTPDVAGALTIGDDGAVQFNYDGTSSTGGRYLESAAATKDFRMSPSVGQMTVAVWAKIKLSSSNRRGHIIGNSNVLTDHSMIGWGLHVMYPGGEIRFTRGQFGGTGSPEIYAQTPGGVAVDEWNLYVATYDGTTSSLYANGNLVASVADTYGVTGDSSTIKVGYAITDWAALGGVKHSWLYGSVDEAAIWTRALTPDEIATLYSGGTTGLLPPAPGSGWQFPPPPPDGGPVGTGSPPGGWTGGTNPGGYYYQAHIETLVLTDSSPARFDVPPRAWTRIPFNHIQIQRQFQPSSSSPGTVNRLLPDDRGLTAAAQNGVLLLPDAAYKPGDPTPDVQVLAWCNPEYPILDAVRLPNGGNPLLVDHYVRALRIRNATTGQVLRDPDFEDGTWRMFFEWPFWQPADGDVGTVRARSTDNPYPAYPPWPGRPLHKPLPYPELPGGISEWLSYYQNNETGYPGWHVIGPEDHFAPGTKFVAEVWQDSPYLLRFTTNVYPHQPPILTMPGWTGGPLYNLFQPFMTISYPFDPATIDHTTGALL